MKKIILNSSQYSFDASINKVTIDTTLDLTKEGLLLITNTTTNDIIYNFGCDGFGGTIEDIKNIITLEYDTSSMQDSDHLQVILYTESTILDDKWSTLFEQQKCHLESLQSIIEELQRTNKLLTKIYS